MKKTCNRCGHELDIDKRCCSSCGAFNPFFIAGFSTSTVQTEILEKQRLEEERLEMELAEKEKREQKLQKELEEAERRHQERLKEIIIESPPKPEAAPAMPKHEISGNLEPVEQNEPEPEKEMPFVPPAKKPGHSEIEARAIHDFRKKSATKRWAVIAALVIMLCMGSSLTYFHFARSAEVNSSALHAEITDANPSATVSPVPANAASMDKVPVVKAINTSGVPKAQVTKAAVPYNKKDITPVEPSRLNRSGDFILTAARVKNDLVGKRLSGCGITIRKAAEFISLGSPVFIEQLPSGYMKYKLAAKIVQGNEIYNSTPYVYYNTNGTFIKVDGTNCE